MAVIAVDFLLGTDISSRIIARYGVPTGGWSHCASVLKDGRYLDARSDVLSGVPAGVHIREAASEPFRRKQRASLVVTDAEYDAWEANLRAKITDAYGRSDIMGFILGRPGHVAGQWICSALAINAIQHISRSWTPPHLGYIPYPMQVAAHAISPDMLSMILDAVGFTMERVEFAK